MKSQTTRQHTNILTVLKMTVLGYLANKQKTYMTSALCFSTALRLNSSLATFSLISSVASGSSSTVNISVWGKRKHKMYGKSIPQTHAFSCTTVQSYATQCIFPEDEVGWNTFIAKVTSVQDSMTGKWYCCWWRMKQYKLGKKNNDKSFQTIHANHNNHPCKNQNFLQEVHLIYMANQFAISYS